MNYNAEIQVKKFTIESLIHFNPKLNELHEIEFNFTGWEGKKVCDKWIQNLKEAKENYDKAEPHIKWNLQGAKKDYQQLLKIFKAIKSSLVFNPNYLVRLVFI